MTVLIFVNRELKMCLHNAAHEHLQNKQVKSQKQHLKKCRGRGAEGRHVGPRAAGEIKANTPISYIWSKKPEMKIIKKCSAFCFVNEEKQL